MYPKNKAKTRRLQHIPENTSSLPDPEDFKGGSERLGGILNQIRKKQRVEHPTERDDFKTSQTKPIPNHGVTAETKGDFNVLKLLICVL